MHSVTAAALVLLVTADLSGADLTSTANLTSQASASQQANVLTGAELDNGGLWKPATNYDPLIDSFVADTSAYKKMDRGSRQAIAIKYGLSGSSLDALISFRGRMEKDGYNNSRKSELRTEALRLVKLSHRAPISLMFAAGALAQFGNRGCTSADEALLMAGSQNPDRDLWAITISCSSSSSLAHAIDRSKAARPALLYLGLTWTTGDPASGLAAADMLLQPSFLAEVDDRHRDDVHAEIARYKLSKLLDVGLLREAIEFGDSLEPAVRARALKMKHGSDTASIGGFSIKSGEYEDATLVDYAAALAVVGRKADARALLERIAPRDALKQARACLESAGKQDCHVGDVWQGRIPIGALIADQLLERPDADPYVLVEAAATGLPLSGGGVTEALCQLLSAPGEQKTCQELRDTVGLARAERANGDDDRTLWAAIAHAGAEPFDRAKARYEAKLAALGSVKTERDWTRANVDPAVPPFHELPLPALASHDRPRPSLNPKSFAPLPAGYTPVRIERSGNRVVAISLSQRFDPDGEVTQGGYWLHQSTDGGKSWEQPLYTGLAEHFPYIVPPMSRLPMIAGDRIHLEVEESLIDTASITYPPIATRIRRKRTGIYLDIPISELRKDSNGDGITDIAARHLLLAGDGHGQTPFIVGKDSGCSKHPDAETLARVEILKKLFHVEASALIEPAGGKSILFGGWKRSEPTAKPPILVRGNPDDYRCLSIDRLMVVYSEADEKRLRTASPDFHLIELPAIRWNRDHTRGFVKWSLGWTGGTYRLMRDDSGWKIESIGSWIT